MLFREVNPEDKEDLDMLYELLKERIPEENISHKEMPSTGEHRSFVGSLPYRIWYIVSNPIIPVGSCYVTKQNEVGIAVLKKYRKQGLGTKILERMIKLYPNLLANINPQNKKSIKLFEKAGFKHIQNTYQYQS